MKKIKKDRSIKKEIERKWEARKEEKEIKKERSRTKLKIYQEKREKIEKNELID